ncbi:Adenosyl-chloride synthase [Anatilimnocola aggregata]|uniref:Adenosyl-chloride synthase n=1 Tax=Anatilimnocola aggregata TaxID=2528021 RepID=A0A517YBC9_9BACT|nr:SAM-dependent chlorinase/fluorinase [Anatilimnocola aggregata]QDU27422.1 Adenosyl-chloride synthase [Anatilimnocola aggregata]
MLLTFTTDFGISSPYVAAMKGAVLQVCSAVEMVDITHGISPQNVRQAAIVLADVAPYFPTNTLHLVVVDPGVGTERKMVYAEIGGQSFLAPDNGVLSYLAKQHPPQRVVALAEPRFWRQVVSNTFHGRDILASVAGHLASGLDPIDLGPIYESLIMLPWNEPLIELDEVRGEVLCIDSFGNLITNLSAAKIKGWAGPAGIETQIRERRISGLQTTYGKQAPGELISLVDSQGRLEIAQVNGNAANALAVQVGDWVRVRRGTKS